jgi:hypothetical protein
MIGGIGTLPGAVTHTNDAGKRRGFMNWEMITAISAVMAAIALVVCLPLIARQLQAATRERKLAAYHAVMDNVDECSKYIARDHANADIWWRASTGVEHLTDVERVRYFALLFMMFRSWERAFHLRNEGEDAQFSVEIVTKPMVDFTMSNGVQEYWALRKRWFTSDFREWVDQSMKERSGVDIYGEQFRMFGSADPRDPLHQAAPSGEKS